MRILIVKKYPLHFIYKFILPLIKKRLFCFDRKKAVKINSYLKSLDSSLSIVEVLNELIKGIKVSEENDYHNIYIPETLTITNKEFSLISIVKLINYGNLEVKGYSFIENIFGDIQDNQVLYYQTYLAKVFPQLMGKSKKKENMYGR